MSADKIKHSEDVSASLKNRFIDLTIKKPENLKNDFLSGLTVALALVPEAIAFAFVAGVHPKVGLYAAFMMGLITAIFGGRPGMISGATGAVAVIFAPLVYKVMEMSKDSGMTFDAAMDNALSYLFAAVVIMGLIQIVFGLLKLGKFIRLVPHPVMLGFVNGLAIIIFRAQFSQFTVGGELLPSAQLLVMCGLIALTMGISVFLPKLTKAVPATLVGIVASTVIGYLLNEANPGLVRTVLDFVQDQDKTITTIAAGLPTFKIPFVELTMDNLKLILPYALLAAAVGLIESLMTLQLVDELTDTRGKGNRECVGQGLANMVNGFFGGMGGCAMIGQSMINIRGGGRGRFSGVTAAILLLGFVLFGAPLIEMIPLGALVGVMFMVVIGTFEWSSLRLFKRIPLSDFLVIVLVSVVTILADLAIAVLVGIIVSALVFAWEHGKTMHAKKKDEDDKTIYELDGPLFFGSVTSFKDLFDFKDDKEHVYIDFDNSRVWDHSGIEALQNITERYAQQGKKLHLLNLSKDCLVLLDKASNIVELSVIEDLNTHIADDRLDG
ncbi:inorganic anion transporter, SulP family [Bacteriovorax sp. BAL6_X]|uniref:SulP family inorganic anion transporter n=1 Tax=Bacteriovorax sp. BAL6_X TaxID=1201290 RepID=UPI0003862A3E|nr:SulP family inorganic anion transporter [Bacteriovorax sp. BAL6_X]EPZ52459.1 inorganic anion transporter, SulP family [Bacteriovorax sp. BAL6_X]